MAKSINFVGDRRKRLTKAQKKDKKIMKIMVNILIIVFIFFLIMIAARFFFVFRVKDLKDEQAGVRNVIISQEDIEKDYVIFAQKLKKLSVFFGKRKDKQESLEFFSDVFGDDVIVSGIDFSSADEDVVSFTIKAPNVFIMEEVFNILDGEEVRVKYPNISKSSMRRSGSGNYTINLAVVLDTVVGQAPTGVNN